MVFIQEHGPVADLAQAKSAVDQVLKGVEKLRNLFRGSRSRSEVVATFLAMLELIKANKIKAWGSGDKVIVEQCEELEEEIGSFISEFSVDVGEEETVNEQQ